LKKFELSVYTPNKGQQSSVERCGISILEYSDPGWERTIHSCDVEKRSEWQEVIEKEFTFVVSYHYTRVIRAYLHLDYDSARRCTSVMERMTRETKKEWVEGNARGGLQAQ
jgi:hypothetical protein